MSVDVNKLQAILAKSKEVMRKTDEEYGKPNVGKVTNQGSSRSNIVEYEEKEVPNLTEQFVEKYGMSDGKISSVKSVAPKNGQYRNLEKSKMPKAILEAMINNPIEIPENPFAANSFNLEDVPELIEQPKKQIVKENIQPKPQTKGSVNREEIKQVIREEFEDMVRNILDEYMEKSLVTEDIHIKIGDTIFGGTLKPLPKKNKR